MEAYETLLYPEGVDPSEETIHKRDLFQTMMLRAADIDDHELADAVSRVNTELMVGKIIYPSTFDHAHEIYMVMFEYFKELSSQDKRLILTCVREAFGLFGHELVGYYKEDETHIDEILEDYLKLKVDINTVSPEISEEVEQLANMSDEEFEKKMDEEFGDDDDEESEEDDEEEEFEEETEDETPECPPVAYEEPVPEPEFQPLTEPVHVQHLSDEELKKLAPDTSKYDPEYDIPDEKLYPTKE